MQTLYLQQIRRRLAVRLRNRRIAEGFRTNQELADAIYADQRIRIDPDLLVSIERCLIDCPISTLWVMAEFYRVSINQRIAMQYEAFMGLN